MFTDLWEWKANPVLPVHFRPNRWFDSINGIKLYTAREYRESH